nr:hypothetical protein [Fodinicola feengrottensis]
MPERSTVTINDLTFTIHQNGPADGPAVVLLHGFPQNSGYSPGAR